MSEISLALAAMFQPLVAAAVTPLLRPLRLVHLAHLPAVVGFAAAAVLSFWLLLNVIDAKDPSFVYLTVIDPTVTWFAIGNLNVPFSIHVDPARPSCWPPSRSSRPGSRSSPPGTCTTTRGTTGFSRSWAFSLFSMCLLVLANNFLVLVAGWEGVGLCSYLLVGYYYAKPSAAAAARKAFLVTRLGDVGFLLGIFLLWQVGNYETNLDKLFTALVLHRPTDSTITWACLPALLWGGGKSAQFPLYVWPLDAMEAGLTPVERSDPRGDNGHGQAFIYSPDACSDLRDEYGRHRGRRPHRRRHRVPRGVHRGSARPISSGCSPTAR